MAQHALPERVLENHFKQSCYSVTTFRRFPKRQTPCLNGFEATKEIRKFLPEAAVIFVSIHDATELIEHSKLAGAQVFVSKERASCDLLKAVDAVLQNRQFFPERRYPDVR